MRFGWSANETSARIRRLAMAVVLAFLALYTIFYLIQPFSDMWNTIVTNLFLVIASSLTATVATMIWARYDRTDAPRRIWGYFAVGLWLWAIAEVAWGYLNVTQGEVAVGIPDIFWLSGYLFFGQALLIQYRILAHPTKQDLFSRTLVAVLVFLLLYVLMYRTLISGAEGPGLLGAVINSFYPSADLLLVLVALWLANHFMGGAFSGPWLGLLAFAFADLMYAWLEISGMYTWTINQANLLTTISDVVYLGAYLLLGLGLLSQWIFLKYGLRSPTQPR